MALASFTSPHFRVDASLASSESEVCVANSLCFFCDATSTAPQSVVVFAL